MFRKVLSVVVVILFLLYLGVAVHTVCKERPSGELLCEGILLHVEDSLHYNLIDENLIISILEQNGCNPTGCGLELVDTELLENVLEENSLIERAECFKSIGGKIGVRVKSRVPLFRVMSDGGVDYYVDSQGKCFSNSSIVVSLPLVTGAVTEELAVHELLELVNVISRSDFWNAQIEQIHLSHEGEISLVPRVGDHLLILGKGADFEKKLERLFNFYKKGLDKIGWNKYASISVAYSNQIVCKRR